MYEIILAGFKFGDFPQNRQFAKLKTSPKFPLYSTDLVAVLLVLPHIHCTVTIGKAGIATEHPINRQNSFPGIAVTLIVCKRDLKLLFGLCFIRIKTVIGNMKSK